MISIPAPQPGEYAPYYEKYFSTLHPNEAILTQLHTDSERFTHFIAGIAPEKIHFAYKPEKWTTAGVIQHVIDTERIFAYRALSIARGEKQLLPGFDENAYALEASTEHKNAQLLSLEWMTVRQASFALFAGLTAEDFSKKGNANNYPLSVSAIVHIMVAHARHHFTILNERYL